MSLSVYVCMFVCVCTCVCVCVRGFDLERQGEGGTERGRDSEKE